MSTPSSSVGWRSTAVADTTDLHPDILFQYLTSLGVTPETRKTILDEVLVQLSYRQSLRRTAHSVGDFVASTHSTFTSTPCQTKRTGAAQTASLCIWQSCFIQYYNIYYFTTCTTNIILFSNTTVIIVYFKYTFCSFVYSLYYDIILLMIIQTITVQYRVFITVMKSGGAQVDRLIILDTVSLKLYLI